VIIQVSDGNGGTDAQQITVTVTDINEAPVIDNEELNGSVVETSNGDTAVSISVDENQLWITQIPVKDADLGATRTYSLTGGEDLSAFSIDSDSGDLSFNIAADHETKAQFEVEVTITDNGGLTAVNNVVINVADVNESPMARADNLEAKENHQLIIDPVSSLLLNDTDPEQDTLVLVSTTQPQHGTLIQNAQGLLVYEPNEEFVGLDSFDYVVEDAGGHLVTATVWLKVVALSDAILAAAQPDENEIDETVTIAPQIPTPINMGEAPEVVQINEKPKSAKPVESIDEASSTNDIEFSNAVATENLFTASASAANFEQSMESVDQLPTARTNVQDISQLLAELLEYEFTGLDVTFDTRDFDRTAAAQLQEAIVALREQIDQVLDEQAASSPVMTYAPVAIGATLSAGIVAWLLQSGLLISATITATPLWRPLDPVAILAYNEDEKP